MNPKRSRGITTWVNSVTALGWCVFAVTAVGLTLGLSNSWVEAWFVAALGATLLLVAVPFLLSSRHYRPQITLSQTSVVAGGQAQMTIEVENVSARPQLPALIELPVGDALRVLTVPLLAPRKQVTLETAVTTERRGVIRVGPLTVARQDPLGLLRREMSWPDTRTLYVHPKTVALPPNSAGLVRDLEGFESQRVVDSDLSFHAVREYVPGDALRHVHWKSTAKTGTLMVRQYQETQTARTAVLFDARHGEYSSDDEFELGVSAAASVSLHAVREGRERLVISSWVAGRVRRSVDGLEELPSRTPNELMNAWSELEPVIEGPPFEQLARNLSHTTRDLSLVVIVTGSAVSFERIRRATLAFGSEVHVFAIRVDWLAEPHAQRIGDLTIATIGDLGDLPALMMRGVR